MRPAGEAPLLLAVWLSGQLQGFDVDLVDFMKPIALERLPLDAGKGSLPGVVFGCFPTLGFRQSCPVAAVVGRRGADANRDAVSDMPTVAPFTANLTDTGQSANMISSGERSSDTQEVRSTGVTWMNHRNTCQ
jgi:hypothetical protein